MQAIISVVVPAHNEERVIERCLAAMLGSARPGELEVVVACNGCTDTTAERAARFGPDVRVISIAEASKTAALDAGDAAAETLPRAYVDADVEVSTEALRALARQLSGDGVVLAAAPTMRVDTHKASWGVRAHYQVWQHTDYRRSDMIGSGVYALSARGRARFATFPRIIADDLFVRNLFDPVERLALPHEHFVMHSPRSVAALVQRATRAAAGNYQWRQLYGGRSLARSAPPQPSVTRRSPLVRRLAARPALWPAAAVYAYIYVAARVRGRRKLRRGDLGTWDRDDTSRLAP